jgi:NADPH-dependent 2,4-dienoyl-CoA reductase/sulfur reductase-like enzyme
VERVVVVGAGLAGVATVRALRGRGYAGAVTVVGDETTDPYDRPPLSKGFLLGTVAEDALALVTDQERADWGANWLLGSRAERLDPGGPAVTLTDGRRLGADVVVVATGSGARRLPELEGAPNAHVLRTLEDARDLRDALATARSVLVLGGGFVGCEVASTVRGLGPQVTLVEPAPVLLGRQLGDDLAEVWSALHRAEGTDVRTGTSAARWHRDAAGRVIGADLSDGTTVSTDVVVVAVGGVPRTGWLDGSGLPTDGGLHCDAVGRTCAPGVLGVGDVVLAPDPFTGRRTRVEHWTHALHHPDAVVAHLLGQPAPTPRAPYVWSEQCGSMIQLAGERREGDSMRVEDGVPGEGPFTATFHRAGSLVAVLSVDQPREFGRWRRELRPVG